MEIEKTPAITTELYKGTVKVKFYPDSHQYWVSVNGSKMVRKSGVTTIIGAKDKSVALMTWQKQVITDFLLEKLDSKVKINDELIVEAVMLSDKLKDTAADWGKEIHAWIENYIRFKLKQPGFEHIPEMPNSTQAITGINSFLEWEEKNKVKFISTETIIYSKKHDYIGIEDVTLVYNGIFCDGDFKSSNGLYNGVRLQTAAYAKAREENGGKKSQGRLALRLSKYSEEEYYKREERKKDIKKIIARIQKKEFKDYEIKPYVVFECKFLDDNKANYDRDFKAFLDLKSVFEWDKETDPYYNGENW